MNESFPDVTGRLANNVNRVLTSHVQGRQDPVSALLAENLDKCLAR